MKRKPPIAKGNDTKRFLLRSELIELKFKLRINFPKLNKQEALKRINQIEQELKSLYR